MPLGGRGEGATLQAAKVAVSPTEPSHEAAAVGHVDSASKIQSYRYCNFLTEDPYAETTHDLTRSKDPTETNGR